MEVGYKRPSLFRRPWLIAATAVLIVIGGGTAGLRIWYDQNLKPVSSYTRTDFFTVSRGSSAHQIAAALHSASLIRSVSAFETYVTTNGFRNKLQAGTYEFSPSMSVQTIVSKMINGDIAKDLLTILPGKRTDQIRQAFMKAGYSQSEVDSAFDPNNYTGGPAGDSFLPDEVTNNHSLEGFLYPDSFQKQADTPAGTIVGKSLDEMRSHLTEDIYKGFQIQGLSLYQGVTLASIVEQESGDPANQPIVAQVFLLRLRQGMMLQSNVTAYYAADIAGVARSISIDSPYNTYLHSGLPPGPISNITASALNAVAHPATSTYLYFIAGDDGKMHFSYTAQQQQDAISKYCKQSCAQ